MLGIVLGQVFLFGKLFSGNLSVGNRFYGQRIFEDFVLWNIFRELLGEFLMRKAIQSVLEWELGNDYQETCHHVFSTKIMMC